MRTGRHLHFEPFQLDTADEQLRKGSEAVPLRPKPFALLRYLTEHSGRLVTKETLLDVIRPDAVVSEGVLSVDIAELRKALGDDPRNPRFIETVHGKGYRFIADVYESASSGAASQVLAVDGSDRFVGRNAEIDHLHELFDAALGGRRQIVFISGEPGIGKTTLVEVFLSTVAGGGRVWIGRGQCIDHYGSGEAYLPLLDAIGRICRESDGQQLVDILRQEAPTWVAQMPALLPAAERQKLQEDTQGATRERMLREMSDALKSITSERPLILRLEDLHWSDVSTLDLLAFLARQPECGRLLVIGTYRPVEILRSNHPLVTVRQEMILHGYCEEIALEYLTVDAVGEYLGLRFGDGVFSASLAELIHDRTDGNPLFMVNVVDDLVARGVIAEVGSVWNLSVPSSEIQIEAPRTIESMILTLLKRLDPDDRRILEVASIVGDEFSAETVSAGAGMQAEDVEARCDELVRREQFIRLKGTDEWPDGTITTVYGFIHALYREVLYAQLTTSRRVRLHREVAERQERGFGDRAAEISAELAIHFEYGRDIKNAIKYRKRAGENASQRSANAEAIDHLSKGISLTDRLDDSSMRGREELSMRIMLGPPLIQAKGYAAPEVGENYTTARALWCDEVSTEQLHAVLWGLWLFYVVAAQHEKELALGRELLQLAESERNAALLTTAHYAMECAFFYTGQPSLASEHAERGIAHYDARRHREMAYSYAQDPGVVCRSVGGWALWVRGYPERALRLSNDAVAHAQELAYPFSIAFALNFSAALHLLRGEPGKVLELTESAVTISTEHGFPFWREMSTILRSRALADDQNASKNAERIIDGLRAYRATAAELFSPHFLCLLAEARALAGDFKEATAAIRDAYSVISETAEKYYEPEAYRIEGELALLEGRANDDSQPETRAIQCFRKAVDLARRQGAKSWELRAATSLARLWQQQNKQAEACQLLSDIYSWFSEGFDTKDLQEAKALLEELG